MSESLHEFLLREIREILAENGLDPDDPSPAVCTRCRKLVTEGEDGLCRCGCPGKAVEWGWEEGEG